MRVNFMSTALQNIPFATKPFTNPIVQGFYEYLHQMTHLKMND